MSNLTEKYINDLLDKNFFIPDYQRGYRWKPQQVEDLLNDIWEFSQKTHETENEWYCMQPVVVKRMEHKFEVIDGQQRLTTIFLILKYLGINENFKIEYQTRENSWCFTDEIQNKIEKDSKENIDYFHIFEAFEKINCWFNCEKNQISKSGFTKTFLEDTKVIWYEVDTGKNSIDIFTRLNVGKIPLTNAELIKALFLNSSNFPNANLEELRLKQLEIASEWDSMEYALQNDEFWYFLNTVENKLSTRIDFLFNVMKKMESDKGDKTDKNDYRATYRFFAERFKKENPTEIWREIKRTFQTLEEWFTDRELYHKVGYLIATKTKVTELVEKSKNKRKQEFRKWLTKKIAGKIECDNLEDMEYGGKNNSKITNILLLHNIQTLLNDKNGTSRFPFIRYKKEKWDIEHIHAIATEVKVKKEEQQTWLKNNFVKTGKHNNDKFNSKISDIKNSGIPIEDKEFKRIIEYVLGDEDNSLRNLCLLDSSTNRSYKNDAFKVKRQKLIEKERSGTFIPVCTKNVFMKYYSKEIKSLQLWNDEDRDAYFIDLKTTLENFTNQNNEI